MTVDIEKSTCPGCGATVIRAKAEGGLAVLLNPNPGLDGTIYFSGKGGLTKVDSGSPAPNGAPKFVVHETTCPQRKLFDV